MATERGHARAKPLLTQVKQT